MKILHSKSRYSLRQMFSFLFFLYIYTVRHKAWELNPSPVSANLLCSRRKKKKQKKEVSAYSQQGGDARLEVMLFWWISARLWFLVDSCMTVADIRYFWACAIFFLFTVNYGVLLLSFRRHRWKASSHTFFFFFCHFEYFLSVSICHKAIHLHCIVNEGHCCFSINRL